MGMRYVAMMAMACAVLLLWMIMVMVVMMRGIGRIFSFFIMAVVTLYYMRRHIAVADVGDDLNTPSTGKEATD